MSRKFSQAIIAILSISILFLTVTTSGLIWKQSPATRVITVNDAVNLTDAQKINLVINELMTPQSAKCFRQILTVESHMNPYAKNPHSSARGVGQLLASTYQNLGLQHSADPLAQVVAALAYISRHYGGHNSVCSAWAFERSHNYY